MRIDGTTWTSNADGRLPSQGGPPAGMLVPAGYGERRRGQDAGLPDVPADPYVLVHDTARGVLVIDLYHAAARSDEPPAYRLTEKGTVETGRRPRKGGIIDLVA
jgi:hypothetical protein